MKKEIFLNVAAYALFTLFAYASINKLIAFDFFLHDLKRSPLLGPYALALSILVPATELIICGLLVVDKTRGIGFTASVILMGLFTVYVAFVIFSLKKQPCSCGGIIRNLSWPNHLIFNIVFFLIAVTGTILYQRKGKTYYA